MQRVYANLHNHSFDKMSLTLFFMYHQLSTCSLPNNYFYLKKLSKKLNDVSILPQKKNGLLSNELLKMNPFLKKFNLYSFLY